MPGMDGLKASRLLLAEQPDLIVVFASADPSIREEVFALGVKLFETKPFSMDKMVSDLKGVVDASRVKGPTKNVA